MKAKHLVPESTPFPMPNHMEWQEHICRILANNEFLEASTADWFKLKQLEIKNKHSDWTHMGSSLSLPLFSDLHGMRILCFQRDTNSHTIYTSSTNTIMDKSICDFRWVPLGSSLSRYQGLAAVSPTNPLPLQSPPDFP